MNTKRRVRTLLTEWQEILDLQEWKVQLRLYVRLLLDEQYCHWRFSEKVAYIGLNVNQPLAEIEHSLAHELMHLVLAPTNRVFDNLNEAKTAKKERALIDAQFNLAQNESVEAILRILYKQLGKEYPPHKEM